MKDEKILETTTRKIAKRIHDAMLDQGINVSDLVNLLPYSREQISQAVNGSNYPRTMFTIRNAICKKLKIKEEISADD